MEVLTSTCVIQRRCNNNVVTKATLSGSMAVGAQVFRAGGARGWGLRARQAVARGAPVGSYCGELLALPHADTRSRDHYMFALDVKPDLLEVTARSALLALLTTSRTNYFVNRQPLDFRPYLLAYI